MAALPYIQLYPSDYLADTAHLSTLEHGVYLLLIMNYWQRGKPLPADDVKLARIARITDSEWISMKSMILDFFEQKDGVLIHHRIERDLKKVLEKSIQASDAGKASAERKSDVHSTDVERTLNTSLTDVERPFNHTDTDTDTEIIEKKKKHLLLDPELDMWTKGLKITGEQYPLTDEWRRTLLEIRVNKDCGVENFLKACRNLMRKQDFPKRSITFFVGKKFEAISRVVEWAAIPVKGKSPPEVGKMTAAQQKALDEAPKVDPAVLQKTIDEARKNVHACVTALAQKMTVK